MRVVFTRATCHQQQPATESDGHPFLDCAGEREAAHLILHRLKSGLANSLPFNTARSEHCDILTYPCRMHCNDAEDVKMDAWQLMCVQAYGPLPLPASSIAHTMAGVGHPFARSPSRVKIRLDSVVDFETRTFAMKPLGVIFKSFFTNLLPGCPLATALHALSTVFNFIAC